MLDEKETLVDFLKTREGYCIEGDCLRRPDKSVAAVYNAGRWVTYPTQGEIQLYTVFAGRGFPSLLCARDWTNPGSR